VLKSRIPRNIDQISYRNFFLFGLIGGVVTNIASYIATMLLGLPYPPEALFELLVSPVPGSIQSTLVETLGELPKYGTFAFAIVIFTIFYGVIAVLVGYSVRTGRITNALLMVATATAIPTVISLGLQTLIATSVATLSSVTGWLTAAFVMIIVNLLFGITYNDQVNSRLRKINPATEKESSQPLNLPRRGFLKKVLTGGVALVAVGVASWLGLSILSGKSSSNNNSNNSYSPIPIDSPSTPVDPSTLPPVFRDPKIAHLVSSEVTDSRVFYRVDIDPISPQLDFANWSLKISGLVNTPMTLDKNKLFALPVKEEYATLECVSNTIDPPSGLISNAKWTGVSLADLLNQAGLLPDAKYVVFQCADGYSVGIPLARATAPGALLAYRMNDQLLPQEHGFPLRAIVPDIYGMMNAKWLTEIQVTNQTYLGYWQERGWSNDATINTTSLIYYPAPAAQVSGPIPIAGVAFAGDRGISKVEVSTDGGSTWSEATLKPPRSPYSWVLWAYLWTPNAKGDHKILARATDGQGQLQDPTGTSNFPNGATGYQLIVVNVV
jgi:DMSO/TMAO reductase YedYZ molybdopterin-dependent catalytic subunit